MQFSFSQLIMRAAFVSRSSDAVLFGDRAQSWRQVAETVARFASVLHESGLRAGDRVAMLALNSEVYLQFYFDVPWAAGVIVPINTRLAPAEIVHWLSDSGGRFLLADDAFAPIIERIAPQLQSRVLKR